MRLALGYPAYRAQVHTAHLFQASQLALLLWRTTKQGPLMFYVDCTFIDKARNLLIRQALDARADWLLMCDSDTYYVQPAPILRMISEGQARGAAMVGAAVRLRKWEGEIYNAAVAPDFKPMSREQLGGALRPCDRLGGAFTAINLDWIREHWQESPWFMVQHLAGPQPKTVGEDIWFSDNVRKRGGTILVDPRFEPVHSGACTSETLALAEMGVEMSDV
jgi:hypothetical protein